MIDETKTEPIINHSFWDLGGYLPDISSWITIISFILTIYLLVTTTGIKQKVNMSFKFKSFKLDKSGLLKELQSTRDMMIKDPNDKQNLYDLSEPLRRLADYKIYMDREDKIAFKALNSIVKKGSITGNEDQIIHNLGVLIGFLKKRIDFDTNVLK